jgi:hypothetical protein
LYLIVYGYRGLFRKNQLVVLNRFTREEVHRRSLGGLDRLRRGSK